MVKINYTDLNFDHLVYFERDKTVFAAARSNGDNHLRIFLLYEETGNVYTRNGKIDSWEHLDEMDAALVRNRVEEARDHIPAYRIRGTHN